MKGGAPGRGLVFEPCRQAGFTLLELLVALVLLSLIAVVMTGGLRFGARVWEASHGATDSLSEVAAVRRFIRERAMSIRPVRFRENDGSVDGAFSGDQSSMRFIALMPSYVSRGGLYHVTLAVEREQSGIQLEWRPLGAARDGQGSNQRNLLKGATRMELSYFGAIDDSETLHWREDWPVGDQLPRLLSIKISFPEGDPRFWPELIMPLAVSKANPGTSQHGRRELAR